MKQTTHDNFRKISPKLRVMFLTSKTFRYVHSTSPQTSIKYLQSLTPNFVRLATTGVTVENMKKNMKFNLKGSKIYTDGIFYSVDLYKLGRYQFSYLFINIEKYKFPTNSNRHVTYFSQ